jgi:ADP-ribose pyrophosphatase YjhB (NUDIX family)
MPRHQRIAVYGICRDGDRVLLTRAAPYLTVAGHWFLPGGGLAHGEDPVDGLVREFEEETGLAVEPTGLLGVLSDVTTLPDGVGLHTVRLIYAVDRWAGTLRAEAEGSTDDVRWVDRAELAGLTLMPYVTRALAEWSGPESDTP